MGIFKAGATALCVLTAGFLASPASGRDDARFSMSTVEFQRMPAADQVTLVIRALEYRLEQSRNASYESKTRCGNYAYVHGSVGKLVAPLNGGDYRRWQLGDSYRTEIVRGGIDVQTPDQFITDGFDAGQGVNRGAVHFSHQPQKFGRIDVAEDQIVGEDRYAYWFDGANRPIKNMSRLGEFLVRYVVDHKDGISIDRIGSDGLIHVSVPWCPDFSRKPLGKRKFDLDPKKGFLPVHGDGRWDTTWPSGKHDWRTEQFVVQDSKLVGGLWMPVKLQELVPLSDQEVTVYETTVSKIAIGNVTPADLVVKFSPGTEVVDAIKGVYYFIGPNGEPTPPHDLAGIVPAASVRASGGGAKVWLIALNAGIVLTLGALLLRRRFRTRSRRAQGSAGES